MALDNFRTQKIIWDRVNKKIFEAIEANSGDSNGRKLVVQVINQEVTEVLSGTTLSLGWKSRNGAKGLDAFNVVDASKGIFEIYYTTEMLSNIGNLEASLILIDSTGRIESSTFTISVRPSTVDDESIESENSFTALTEALVKVNDLEENYAPRLNEVTTQLAQTTDENTFNVTAYGAVGDGVTDDTQAIQNVFNNTKTGDTVLIPNGTFLTKDTITVTKPVRIIMNGYILADHVKTGLIFKDDSSSGSFHPNYHDGEKINGSLRVKRVKGKDYEKVSTAIGVELWNVFSGVFHLEDLEGHHIGMVLRGDKYGTGYAGTTYCMFTIGVLNNYKDNILLKTSNLGYVTQNQFYSGSMTGANVDDLETIHVNIDGGTTGYISANTFYSVSFEGHKKKAVKGRNSRDNRFIDCRYELPSITHVFDLENSMFYLFDKGTQLANHITNGLYNDNEESLTGRWKSTNAIFIDYRIGVVEYIDGIFYVKPLNNNGPSYANENNSIDTGLFPEGSDVRLVSDGFKSNRFYSSALTVENETIHLPIVGGDELAISWVSDNPFTTIELRNPPKYSKEFIVRVESLNQDVPLVIGSDISNLFDTKNLGNIITTTKRHARLYYEFRSNSLFILDYF